MSTASKVLWGEGLFLRPQHFQQQDQYHEHRLHESVKALHPYAWGVSHVQFDREALVSNTLRVLELSLIFPDGEIYNAPGNDDLPERGRPERTRARRRRSPSTPPCPRSSISAATSRRPARPATAPASPRAPRRPPTCTPRPRWPS